MPELGIWTTKNLFPPPELVEAAVYDETELGYRHFDSASVHMSQSGPSAEPLRMVWLEVGRNSSLLRSFGARMRSPMVFFRQLMRVYGQGSLSNFLFFCFKAITISNPFLETKGTCEEMKECNHLGLAKAIGVSNFTCKKLE
ncbi:uncharacterized protein A4U43_C03F12560 [Asparagus officinalis]|uniref:NADP-dependent oxidoreductase domain-containing protein n=1 Tax=Asparagus officinalis TaxID=4686 RepID=A0A5P1F9G0_ASPOF|nr:uncharacterized protein A4U43_C03F12560 [Asparagus officinalis]